MRVRWSFIKHRVPVQHVTNNFTSFQRGDGGMQTRRLGRFYYAVENDWNAVFSLRRSFGAKCSQSRLSVQDTRTRKIFPFSRFVAVALDNEASGSHTRSTAHFIAIREPIMSEEAIFVMQSNWRMATAKSDCYNSSVCRFQKSTFSHVQVPFMDLAMHRICASVLM